MKTLSVLVTIVAGKAITTQFDDLLFLSNKLKGVMQETSGPGLRGTADAELQEEVLKWQFDAYDASQASKEEISNKQLFGILARGKILNLQSMLTIMGGPDTAPKEQRGYTTPQDKFSKYGCYCTPHAANVASYVWVGKGQPVDEIDLQCRHLWWAYRCLAKDYGEDCDSTKAYDWKIGGDGEISCVDKKGTCKGDLCRLDLEFTKAVTKASSAWNPLYHMDNGFDRHEQCNAPNSSGKNPNPTSYENNGNPNEGRPTQCCGKGLDRKMFNPTRLECCKDGTTKAIGNCY